MKFISAAIIAFASSTSAFTTPASKTFPSTLRMSENAAPPVVEDPLPDMSISLPFLPRPKALTGALAGDVGFDPFGFAKSEADLMNYREAEIKHARLAMLVSGFRNIKHFL